MSKFLLTISKDIKKYDQGSCQKESDTFNYKNLNLSFNKNDSRFSHSCESSLFVFAFSKLENTEVLKEKFKLSKTNSDADLIIKLFQILGKDFFCYLNGSFSLIIYNNLTGQIYAGSDHNGFLPLYYHLNSKSITFASDPSTLFLRPYIDKRLDEDILLDYLVCGLAREGRTIYKNVNHVCGNKILKTFDEFNGIESEEYFTFKSNPFLSKNLINETRRVFLNTISSKLQTSDKNIASMLSGGLDSSSITCAIDYLNKKNKLNKQLFTYSAVFPNLDLEQRKKADESFYIDAVLSNTNSIAVKKSFDEYGPMNILDELTDISEPALAPNLYITYSILKNLKENNIKILFDGGGGDSVIGHGHARFLELGKKFNLLQLIKEYRQFSSLRKRTISLLSLFKKFVIKPLIPFNFQRKKLLARKDNFDYFNLNLFLKDKINFNSYERFNFIHGYFPYIDLPNNPNIYKYEEASANSLFAKYASRLSFHIGKKFDVEIITPYYDKSFMQHCLNVPMKEKMKDGRDRNYFREAMKEIVPDSILERTDKGDLSSVFRNEFNRIPVEQILDLIIPDEKSYFNKIIDRKKLLIFINAYKKNPHQQNANILYKLVYMSQWVKKNF